MFLPKSCIKWRKYHYYWDVGSITSSHVSGLSGPIMAGYLRDNRTWPPSQGHETRTGHVTWHRPALSWRISPVVIKTNKISWKKTRVHWPFRYSTCVMHLKFTSIFSCEGAAQHLYLCLICLSIHGQNRISAHLIPFLPVYTPLHLMFRLCAFPLSPFVSLYAPLQAFSCFVSWAAPCQTSS